MPARRRIALSLATAALLVPVTVGCSALDTALDCVETADTIATSVDKLQQAVSSAAEDPTQARQALDDIDKELKSLGDKTDNADLSKAVDDLGTGVDNVRKSIENGDTTPDISPVTDSAAEIGKVCTPG
jgi:phage tail sheath gpL-like